MSKFIDKITWNKDVDGTKPEYPLGVSARNVVLNKDMNFSLADFFSWINNYFENGNFIYTGSERPRSFQTKVWYDTNN